jgi:arylsulfatase A-like enzyme
MPAPELAAEVAAYEESIAYMDAQLDVLIDSLDAHGELDNTLIIVTSDHGEEFGEHGVFGHGFNLHWLPLHVPLLVSLPSRVPAGKVVREPVSLRDIAATVVDLLKIDGMTPYPGNSLARQWDGAAGSGGTMAEAVLSEIGGHAHDSKWPGKSLVAGRYHYIKNGEGREMLYDIENDPFEKHDLAQTEEGRRVCERFRNHLDTIFASNRR